MITLLAQMISAKFSHELSGILGAIKNSMEFIDNPNSVVKDQSVKLASCAANTAVLRLRFFRELYGYSDDSAGIANMQSLIRDFFAEKSTKVFFENLETLNSNWTTSNHIKLFLCTMVLSQAHLRFGGEIKMLCKPLGGVEISVFGEHVSFPIGSRKAILTGVDKSEMSIWNVHEHYARQLADQLHLRIFIKEQDGHVCYNIVARDRFFHKLHYTAQNSVDSVL